jgi:RimJ/RimL family protein N-acetyltransferase
MGGLVLRIGWTLRRESWGYGFAKEGARTALRFAFEELDQPHVIIHPLNRRSIHVAERLGESLEGRTEVNGHEALIYGISRERWRDKGHSNG